MSIGYENGVYTFFSKSVFGRWKEVRKFDISEFEGLKVCSYEKNLFVLDYDTLIMYGWRNKSGLEKIFTRKMFCCKEIVSMQVITGWIGTVALFIIDKEMISVMIIGDDNGEFHCIYLENRRHVNISRLYNQFMKYLREIECNDTDIIFTIAFPKHTERYISRVLSCVYVIHTLIKINGSLDKPSLVKSARKI